MTAEEFQRAIAEMKNNGIIPAGHGWKTALADKLGVARPTIDRFEANGTKQLQTDYAIAALIRGIQPYPSTACTD